MHKIMLNKQKDVNVREKVLQHRVKRLKLVNLCENKSQHSVKKTQRRKFK